MSSTPLFKPTLGPWGSDVPSVFPDGKRSGTGPTGTKYARATRLGATSLVSNLSLLARHHMVAQQQLWSDWDGAYSGIARDDGMLDYACAVFLSPVLGTVPEQWHDTLSCASCAGSTDYPYFGCVDPAPAQSEANYVTAARAYFGVVVPLHCGHVLCMRCAPHMMGYAADCPRCQTPALLMTASYKGYGGAYVPNFSIANARRLTRKVFSSHACGVCNLSTDLFCTGCGVESVCSAACMTKHVQSHPHIDWPSALRVRDSAAAAASWFVFRKGDFGALRHYGFELNQTLPSAPAVELSPPLQVVSVTPAPPRMRARAVPGAPERAHAEPFIAPFPPLGQPEQDPAPSTLDIYTTQPEAEQDPQQDLGITIALAVEDVVIPVRSQAVQPAPAFEETQALCTQQQSQAKTLAEVEEMAAKEIQEAEAVAADVAAGVALDMETAFLGPELMATLDHYPVGTHVYIPILAATGERLATSFTAEAAFELLGRRGGSGYVVETALTGKVHGPASALAGSLAGSKRSREQ